jgi:dolichyl-phosphate beta-glucosyltransferase
VSPSETTHEGFEPTSVHVVVPVLNAGPEFAPFLEDLLASLTSAGWRHSVQVVDDGSSPALAELVQEKCCALRETFPSLLPIVRLEKNRGKGAAVRAGWDVQSAHRQRWLAFIDADGSVPSSELVRILNLAAEYRNANCCIIGSRQRVPERRIQRKFYRHVVGRVFASLTARLIGLSAHDTQCGCKILPLVAYQGIRDTLSEDRFSFDVELLAHLQRSGCNIIEVPIDWADRGQSTVRLWRDAPEMLLALFRIRKRLRQTSR